MTVYILESIETPGHYYVSDFPPPRLDVRHAVTVTDVRSRAFTFAFATTAALKASTLPGVWRTVAIQSEEVAA